MDKGSKQALKKHMSREGYTLESINLADPVLKGKKIAEVVELLNEIQAEAKQKGLTYEEGSIESYYESLMLNNDVVATEVSNDGWRPLEDLSKEIWKAVTVQTGRTTLVCTHTDSIMVSRSRLPASAHKNNHMSTNIYLIQSTITKEPVVPILTTEWLIPDISTKKKFLMTASVIDNPRAFKIPNAEVTEMTCVRKPELVKSSLTPEMELTEIEPESLEMLAKIISAGKSDIHDINTYEAIVIKPLSAEQAEDQKCSFVKEFATPELRYCPIPEMMPQKPAGVHIQMLKQFIDKWERIKTEYAPQPVPSDVEPVQELPDRPRAARRRPARVRPDDGRNNPTAPPMDNAPTQTVAGV